jgi:hypothetical protein
MTNKARGRRIFVLNGKMYESIPRERWRERERGGRRGRGERSKTNEKINKQ